VSLFLLQFFSYRLQSVVVPVANSCAQSNWFCSFLRMIPLCLVSPRPSFPNKTSLFDDPSKPSYFGSIQTKFNKQTYFVRLPKQTSFVRYSPNETKQPNLLAQPNQFSSVHTNKASLIGKHIVSQYMHWYVCSSS
jgi:hypothetical protein